MLVRIYDNNPSEKEVQRVVAALNRDEVIIYPTDTLYAFGCSIRSVKAIEQMRQLKGKGVTNFAVVFSSISQIAEYCRVDNATFQTLKRNLPGRFTFILTSSSRIPDKALAKRKTIGVRIPSNAVCQAIVGELGCPLVTTSVPDDAETEYMTNPELLAERYEGAVALVVDGGEGSTEPTTVVDLSRDEAEIIRVGAAELR